MTSGSTLSRQPGDGLGMRVVQVTPRGWSCEEAGGGERYTSELTYALEALPNLSVDSFVVAPGRRLSLKNHRGETTGWRHFLRALAASDVVHVHQLNSAVFDLASLFSLLWRKPLVLTDHGGGWRTPGRVVPSGIRLRAVRAVAAVSAYSLHDLRWPASRPSAVLWGGGDHILRHDRVSARVKGSDLLFVGRLLPHKGIHLLIEALPPDVSLRIAGRVVDDRYLTYLEALARSKDVEFVLNPPDGLLRSLYERATYTVLPSVSEAFGRAYARPELLGLTLLESLATGTPFIASPVGGAGELAREIGMPTLSTTSVQDARECLERLSWTDSVAYTSLIDRAEAAAQRYSWNRVAEDCLGLYRLVARERLGLATRTDLGTVRR